MSINFSASSETGDQIPLVSVVIPSYNQSSYIEKAINSVLSQDFVDIELLVSDDASPDNSWEIIQRIKDPRIRTFQQKRNLGPVGNLVFLIKESRGKYVALLNSDDFWLPGKLGKQVEIMESDSKLGACFTWADLVNESGDIITGAEAIWSDVFRQPNRSQAEWLSHFFFCGNCICHPSMLVRREVYSQLGFYNPALRQLPDFEMWIRMVKHHPIYVIQETLVGHLRTGVNTSVLSAENSARNLTELSEIFYTFFRDIPDDLFIAGFESHFRLKGVQMTSERLHCEKLFLLLDSGFAQAAARSAAIRSFYDSFCDPELEQILLNEYIFSVFDYYQITGKSGFGYFCLQATNQKTLTLCACATDFGHVWRNGLINKFAKKVIRLLRRWRFARD